jgi:3-hydroxyisobutyrate dehydrogenase-like beta-hydroxyacid dehydrogenase
MHPSVGVIGTGAMGIGVVASLRRGGVTTHARDIRPEAQRAASALGATCHSDAASLARASDIVIILVVDAEQIDTVLFGAGGAAAALRQDGIVMVSSTVAPDYTEALAPRLAAHGVSLIDGPVSGGPQRAADGTMTIMLAGPPEALARCETVIGCIAGRAFHVGNAPGDAAKFKIVNNLLAAVNLAAGAEALALAVRAGLDPRQVVGSWIFADRMPRALAGDYTPRAATRILTKDVSIAAEFAARIGASSTFATAARDAFRGAVAAGFGDEDDAAICKYLGALPPK